MTESTEPTEKESEGCGMLLFLYAIFLALLFVYAFTLEHLYAWFVECFTHTHLDFWHVLGLMTIFAALRMRASDASDDTTLTEDVRRMMTEIVGLFILFGIGVVAHHFMLAGAR